MEINEYAMNETAKRVMESIVAIGKMQVKNHVKRRFNVRCMPSVNVRLSHVWHDTTAPIKFEVLITHENNDVEQVTIEAGVVNVICASYHPNAEQIATLESAM